jgi:hypothetical protein
LNSELLYSAKKLHNFIYLNFWDGAKVTGSDPGLMFNLRLFRFVKSYFPYLSRNSKYFFLQAQGYWIRANWDLFKLTSEPSYKDIAIACSNAVLAYQRPDGYWEYPLKEWKDYVSTVEGCWAALGLLKSYRETADKKYLDAAIQWYNFVVEKIGFEPYLDSLAVNYFAFSPEKRKVPNNATLILWLFSELYDVTADKRFTAYTDKLIRFLEITQKPDGELIYEVGKEHYLCYQYNSFEFIDLMNTYNLTNNPTLRQILIHLSKFISSGVTKKGSVKYSCNQELPEFILFSTAAGAALLSASKQGLGDYCTESSLIYDYILKNQRPDGSFYFSRRDMVYYKTPISWGFLTDKTRYPRQLCYILQHILNPLNCDNSEKTLGSDDQ